MSALWPIEPVQSCSFQGYTSQEYAIQTKPVQDYSALEEVNDLTALEKKTYNYSVSKPQPTHSPDPKNLTNDSSAAQRQTNEYQIMESSPEHSTSCDEEDVRSSVDFYPGRIETAEERAQLLDDVIDVCAAHAGIH